MALSSSMSIEATSGDLHNSYNMMRYSSFGAGAVTNFFIITNQSVGSKAADKSTKEAKTALKNWAVSAASSSFSLTNLLTWWFYFCL